MLHSFQTHFPEFYARLMDREDAQIEGVLPPATAEDIAEIEKQLGIALPDSYKQFLKCARGLWLLGGIVQFSTGHPFFHDFPSLQELTPKQREVVSMKGGSWPPPSQGMLCFAEFFMEADGDQVLWDVSKGLQNREYPVFYYAHEKSPPSVRKLADRFDTWLNEFLTYPEFVKED
jgi:hypothetical protein